LFSFVILSEDCPSRAKREGQPQSKDPCNLCIIKEPQGILKTHRDDT
jgi:hypothetical protein